jgi:hypothetical protein
MRLPLARALSKQVYGTPHTLSLGEVWHAYEKGQPNDRGVQAQYGTVTLSDEAGDYCEGARPVPSQPE